MYIYVMLLGNPCSLSLPRSLCHSLACCVALSLARSLALSPSLTLSLHHTQALALSPESGSKRIRLYLYILT